MKLDQKYFIPFMIVVAVITMAVIVLSSFNFKHQQEEDFSRYTSAYDSLLTLPIPYITSSDSLKLGELKDSITILVFWASWSDRSVSMLKEMNQLKQQYPNMNVAAALVKDATASAIPEIPEYDFRYIDGTRLFNELRVPGIPSYVILDRSGSPVQTKVGYRKGEVSTLNLQAVSQ